MVVVVIAAAAATIVVVVVILKISIQYSKYYTFIRFINNNLNGESDDLSKVKLPRPHTHGRRERGQGTL